MGWFQRLKPSLLPGRSSGNADGALRRALLALLEQELDETERALEDAVRADPDDTVAYFALARLYRRRGEIGRAIRMHQNLLVHPTVDAAMRDTALSELAADFRRGGFLRRAIASYEEVLSKRPRDADALRNLSRLLPSVREYERAIEMERRLAKLEGRKAAPREASLLVEMAEAAHAEGRTDDARRALRRALRKDRECVSAWIALGELEAERGRTKAALKAWRRVPQLDRSSAPLIYPRLEATYAAADRSREYETLLRDLLSESQDDTEARLALARTLAARGEVTEAVAECRRVLERSPDHFRARVVLGRTLLAEGQDAEAHKAYAELLDAIEDHGAPPVRGSLE